MMNGPTAFETEVQIPGSAGIAPEFNHVLWERLRREQLGVNVVDPLGHRIGSASAGRYEPVDGLKHVLVGEFDHYGFYDPRIPITGWDIGDEADFNIHLAPDPPFRFILDQVANDMSDKSQLSKRQRGPGFCVECEVTPDEGFWENPYFSTDEPYRSPLIGRKLGAYGPWVHDNGHGGRPEIHPSEFLWWDSATNAPGVRFTRFFLLLQDDSDRFSRASNFDPPLERPWAAFPRRADITVAIQPVARHGNHYRLRLLRSREIIDMPNANEASITVSFQGQPVVTLEKLMSRPSQIYASLGSVASDPDGRFLRCFLRLSLQVGSGDQGQEGYALLRLETMAPASL